MYQGTYIPIKDFKGGYCGNLSSISLNLNQALDLDNLVILPNGLGWRSRRGNSKVTTTAFNSGAAWQGLGHLLRADGSEFMVGVAGTKVGANQISGATWATSFSDITGTLTITAGQDNIWDFFTFNDKIYAFGGPKDNPDTPFKYAASGNAATISASAPLAYGGFAANNRAFAFRTNANPSTIYWSIVGDATDWASAGSGSAVVGSLNDNEKITGAAVLSSNYVMIFKDRSTYQMIITTNPFPIYSFSTSVGCIGKHAIITVDGVVYWINQYCRMVSTNGESIQHYPASADVLWNAVSSARRPYIYGFRLRDTDLDWLVWCVSTNNTSNNKAIIWDLLNNCWLQCTTGHSFQASVVTVTLETLIGGYDGLIYNQNDTNVYSDASETSPGTITSYWQSGWLNFDAAEKIIQPNEVGVVCFTKSAGTVTLDYGFDFIANSATTVSFSLVPVSTETKKVIYSKITGRGNYFNFKISHSSSTLDASIDQIYLRGKEYGQKVFTNP